MPPLQLSSMFLAFSEAGMIHGPSVMMSRSGDLPDSVSHSVRKKSCIDTAQVSESSAIPVLLLQTVLVQTDSVRRNVVHVFDQVCIKLGAARRE